jgi:beta-glucosidase
VERPVRWLVGFGVARLAPGQSGKVGIAVPSKLLAHWADGWQYEVGDFTLRAGTSANELPLETRITLETDS